MTDETARALDLWLMGNDSDSLPLLATEARDGDRIARLALARIETTDRAPSPFRLGLSRKDARALFRDTSKGLLGKSWLMVQAQSGDALAQALMDSKRVDIVPGLVDRLHKLGEPQASDYPTRILALNGTDEDRGALRSGGKVLPELDPYLDYLSGQAEPRGDGVAALRHISGQPIPELDDDTLSMAGILSLGWEFGDLTADNRWRDVVEDWLMTAPATRPLADACLATCGNAAPACAFTLFAMSGGYFEAIRLDSPLELAIPQQKFLASPRARLMAVRRAALARTETNALMARSDEIGAVSACAAQLVSEERGK